MKLVIQRVSSSSVTVDGKVVGQIGLGLLVLLGIGQKDTKQEVNQFVQKIIQLRIFEDGQGKMNLSAKDAGAEFLVVSQFTLYGDCRKGRRPSFDKAGDPKEAERLYEYFVQQLKKEDVNVQTGIFGAMMDVALVNDGPVTFILESQNE